MDALYSAEQIANWILWYNNIKDTEVTDYVTPLKLQKLLYYSAGVYLAINDKPLFSEPIIAWQHGPIVRSVYDKYATYGAQPIFADKDFEPLSIDEDTSGILRGTYDAFGQYTAWRLREMTHQETPWQEAWAQGRDTPLNNDTICKYFKEHYVE